MENTELEVIEESVDVESNERKCNRDDLLKAGGVIAGTIVVWEAGKAGVKWIGKKVAPTKVGKAVKNVFTKKEKTPKDAPVATEETK